MSSLAFLTTGYAPANAQSTENTTQGFSIEQTATPVKEADAKLPSKFVINKDFTDPDNNCEFCTAMIYTPGTNEEAGLAYKDIKLDLGDSQRIVFFARSEKSGEQVSFVAAGNDTSQVASNDTDIFPKIDFAITTENVTIDDQWQRFQIALNGTELDDASYPFGVQLTPGTSNQKQTFFLKGVTIDSRPAQDALPTVHDAFNSTVQLEATINANSTNSSVLSTIEFGANTTGGLAPYSYSWNFGDGTNSTDIGPKVSHTFNEPGNHTITLGAIDSGTPSQNATANMVVTIDSAANQSALGLMTTMINANGTNSSAPATIEFGAEATGGLAPYSYSWNFGDGTNSTDIGPKVSHTFNEPGNHTITLGAIDSGTPSQNATANMVVTIDSAVDMKALETLVATINANGTNSSAPATIEFGAEATGGLAPYSYSWNFGDGTNSTDIGPKVSHTFNEPGNHTITLGAIDSGTPSQNATANMVVTIDSAANQSALGLMTTMINANSTNIDNLNGTNIDNLNGTNIDNLNGTNIDNLNGTNIDNLNGTNIDNLNGTNIDNLNGTNIDNLNGTESLAPGMSVPINSTSGMDSPANEQIKLPVTNSEVPQSETAVRSVDDSALVNGTVSNSVNGTTKPDTTNYSPVADAQSLTFDTNTGGQIALKGTDKDGDVITFELVSPPSKGVLAGFNKDTGMLTYIPNPDFRGIDGFVFKVIDSQNTESNVAWISINVSPKQGILPSVLDVSIATSTDKSVFVILTGSGTDDGGGLKFIPISNPSHGKLTDLSTIDDFSAKITYTPDQGYSGIDSFQFKADDRSGSISNIATVSVTVVAPPPISNNLDVSNNQNDQTAVGPGLLASNTYPISSSQSIDTEENKKARISLIASDADRDQMIFSIVTPPLHGKLAKFDSASGKLTFSPNENFAGEDSFTFRVTDQKGQHSNIAKVSIRVSGADSVNHSSNDNDNIDAPTPDNRVTGDNMTADSTDSINHNPSANAGLDRTVYGGTNVVTLKGTGNDPDGDRVSYSWRQTAGPPVNLVGANTAKPKFTIPGSVVQEVLMFELTVTDEKGGQDNDIVKITMKNKELAESQVQSQFNNNNHDPSGNAGLDRTVYGGTNVVTLKGTGNDPDGDRVSYSWRQTAGPPVNLVGANTAKPKFTIPGSVVQEVLMFELTVTDEKGGQDTDDLKIIVKDQVRPSINDHPYPSKRQMTVNQTSFLEQLYYYDISEWIFQQPIYPS